MDPVSHVVLGTAASQPHADRSEIASMLVAGTAGALAPDVDVLIRSASDPLLFLEMHRQFTHSLAFLPVGSLAVAALAYAGLRGRAGFLRLWLFGALGYASHLLLDACTAYGIALLWPVSGARPALSIISVVDPLFTLPAAALVGAALLRRRRGLAAAALCWAAAYLIFGAVQAARAESAAAAVAAGRGHEPGELIAVPSFGNSVVWKTLYEHDGRYYVDAIRVGLEARLYAGESLPVLEPAEHLSWLAPGTRQARDLSRFRRVANGYLALDPIVPNRVIELRYSLVPNSVAPFWALELDPRAGGDAHARFVTTREHTPAQGLQLLRMVLGRAPGEPIGGATATHGSGPPR